MKLARHRALDALCAEYVLGTLRGHARRRFERAMREEALVATRVAYWQNQFALRYSEQSSVAPSPEVWSKIARDLDLQRYKTPWYAKLGLGNPLRAGSFVATIALTFALGWFVLPTLLQPQFQTVATLAGDNPIVTNNAVIASLSKTGDKVSLKANRALAADTQKSFEVWLLPKGGGAPVSLAVLSALDAQFDVPRAQVGNLARGAKLAVSIEPRGGSKTGAPTGPVILVGTIES
jgi:anti-sigma-K factor RskA